MTILFLSSNISSCVSSVVLFTLKNKPLVIQLQDDKNYGHLSSEIIMYLEFLTVSEKHESINQEAMRQYTKDLKDKVFESI